MKDLIQKAGTYKMAIVIGMLFSINSLSTAIVASFMNADWANLDGTSKFLLVVVVIQNWTGTMIAFANKTLARIEQGKLPLETGDTQLFNKPQPTTP